MTLKNIKNKLIAVLAVLFCALLAISAALLIPKTKTANAVTSNAKNYTVSDLLGDNTAKPFNADSLSDLYYRLTGEQGATYSSVASKVNGMATSATVGNGHLPGNGVMPNFLDAGSIRTNVRKTQNQNNATITGELLVKLNNKLFSPVYLTRDKDNNVILTLWLAETDKTAQYNEWSSSNCAYAYPSHMYSTSKVRAYLVGTDYIPKGNSTAVPASQLASGTSIQSSDWTDFTSPAGSLYNYIVAPVNVKYQEVQSYTIPSLSENYTRANDAYGEPHAKNFFWAGNINVDFGGYGPTPNSRGEIYKAWKNDKIWIPSQSEIGIGSDTGIWNISTEQASNGDNLTGTNRTGLSISWVRSGTYNADPEWFPAVGSHKGYVGNSPYVYNAIRPAIHLNLTKAEEYSIHPLTVEDVSNPYNGETQTLNSLVTKPAWYRDEVFTEGAKAGRVEYVGNMTDGGEHTVKVTLLDKENYWWSDNNTSSDTRTFKYTITKAPLKMQTLKVDENGDLQGDGDYVNDILTNIYLSTNLYDRDVGKGTAPQFGLQYKKANGGSWSTEKPTIAGEYLVKAYIINADECNYYLASDGQATFIRPKEYIETPHFTQTGLDPTAIVGSTTTVQYSGDYQEFKLVNTADDNLVGITVGERTGGLSYDQKTGTFRAKAVGIYTVEVLLEDGGANTQWDNDSSAVSKTVTLIITKAELDVNILDSDITSWTKGDKDYISVEVSGVRNGESVKLDVYYTVAGSSDKTFIADSAMVLDEASGVITVTVNLATFETNKQYQLFVTLRENISANDNYTLVNHPAPYEFFIMTATIKESEIVEAWTVSNLISGTQEAVNGTEVEYNGSAYTLALDESKIVKGLDAEYTDATFTDVKSDGGFYTTKVKLTCKSGYQFASGNSSVNFEISWKIKPIEFDVASLIWADNPEWNDASHTMCIINLPSWLTEGYYQYSNNTGTAVQSYTAKCVLSSDGNYIFKYSGTDSANNVIEYEGQQATLTHVWEITKKIINVTNAPKQWTTEAVTYSADDTNYYYNIFVPTGLDEYVEKGIVKITYWEDSNFLTSVDIKQLTVDYEVAKTYYIKIEISDADDYNSTYAMYNTLTKGDFASTSFTVGGDKTIIEVTYDSSDELMYNGKPQEISASYRTLTFKYTYYNLDNEMSALEGAPTELGNYKVVVEIDGDEADNYWVQNSVFYFSIVKLVLTTNGYKSATGNELKESVVISEADVDTSDYFEYQIFDKNNTKVNYPAEQLQFNTTYTVKLVLTEPENSVWADDAVTTYTFTTLYDPNAETKYFGDPTITVTDKDGQTVSSESVVWTGEDFTVTINDWTEMSPLVTVTVNGAEINDGSFIRSDVGVYTVTITIKEEAKNAAGWLWDSGSLSKTVEFEITRRHVTIPTASTEYVYDGETKYLFPDGYEELFVNLSDGAVISAVNAGGEWEVTLSLKNKEFSCWTDGSTIDLTFTWSIAKAKIDGQWVEDNGFAEFVSDDASRLSTTYWNSANEEVAFEDLKDGETYTAKIAVKDDYKANYEFADGVELEHEFTFVDTGILVITGTWSVNAEGYAEFVANTSAFADKFTTTYYDADGNEISVAEMVDGEIYTAKIEIKDEYAEGFKFADSVDVEYEFTYSDPTPPTPPEENLDEKKENAKGDLRTAAQEKNDEIDNNPNLTDEEKQELKDKVDEELQKGLEAIENATTADEVDSSLKEAEGKIRNIGDKKGGFPWIIVVIFAFVAIVIIIIIVIVIVRKRRFAKEEAEDNGISEEYQYDDYDDEDDE